MRGTLKEKIKIIFERPHRGKNICEGFPRKKIYIERGSQEEINSFRKFPTISYHGCYLQKVEIRSVLDGYIQAKFSCSFILPFFSEMIFMRGGDRGNLFRLFLIVKVVALVIFRSQDVAVPFNKPTLSLKLYWQLYILSQDCRCVSTLQRDSLSCDFPFFKPSHISLFI